VSIARLAVPKFCLTSSLPPQAASAERRTPPPTHSQNRVRSLQQVCGLLKPLSASQHATQDFEGEGAGVFELLYFDLDGGIRRFIRQSISQLYRLAEIGLRWTICFLFSMNERPPVVGVAIIRIQFDRLVKIADCLGIVLLRLVGDAPPVVSLSVIWLQLDCFG
jgi:hypothetical protein